MYVVAFCESDVVKPPLLYQPCFQGFVPQYEDYEDDDDDDDYEEEGTYRGRVAWHR